MTRADGVHWRTGPASNGRDGAADPIFDVLTSESPTILNEPEAQWHWAAVAARRPNGLTVWRASPESKPAQRNWDAHAFSRDVFKNLDAHHARAGVYPSDVLLLNELNLNYERGDNESDVDTDMWRARYALLSEFLAHLLTECKARAADRAWSPRWWFPAWAPGHGEQMAPIADLWRPVARAYDGVCLHSYDDRETITDSVLWYAEQFPDQPLLLGEWNAPQSLTEEAAIRSRLRSLCDAIPRLQCCYFIWRWEQDSGQRTYDIEGVDARLALWDGRVVLPADDWAAPADPMEAPMPDLPLGIDISNWQGHINWAAVQASGVQFAYAKASEGAGYRDPTFARNWAGMLANGIIRGAYHFARPSGSGAVPEADLFLSQVDAAGGLEAGDFLVLDLEDEHVAAGTDLSTWVIAWLRYVEGRVGFKPLVYTGAWYAPSYGIANEPTIGEYGLIVAAYQAQMPAPFAPWSTLAFWQYTDKLYVPGIAGPVDGDYFNGPADRIRLYGKPAAAPLAPGYSVGSGILNAMRARGDEPATDEVYQGSGGQFSEAFGRSGRRYVWVPSTGAVYVFEPAA